MNSILFFILSLVCAISLLANLTLHERLAQEDKRREKYIQAYVQDLEMRFIDRQIYVPKK